MLGAIIGDIAGSRFEWNNIKTKEFDLLTHHCKFTDDTVMSLAVAQALLDCGAKSKYFAAACVKAMQKLGQRYPHAGYGGRFRGWIYANDPQPYKSWGNGSAMRVSACGWVADTLENVLELAEISAAVTHNHPEGIKGAQATATAIFLARKGKSIPEIHDYIVNNFYPLDFTLDDIRDGYSFDVSCQGSVPQAIEAFLESTSFEDAIRNAVSIGGDSDTIAAITGSIAEAYYGIPDAIRKHALTFLTDDLLATLNAFEAKYGIAVTKAVNEGTTRTSVQKPQQHAGGTDKSSLEKALDAADDVAHAGETETEDITAQKLYSHLYHCCDILHGPFGSDDYRSYVIPLLFFKRISDIYDEETEAAKEKYGDMLEYYPESEIHTFLMPEGCHWNDVRETTEDVGRAVIDAMMGIEKANPNTLSGLFSNFDEANWTDKSRLSDERLKNLVEHMSSIKIGNSNYNADVMGDAYEYLIRSFADMSKKNGGEFYTPRPVVKLMVRMMDPKPGESVYDPACGTGGMLIAAINHMNDIKSTYGKIYGQEKVLDTSSIARMNLYLHGAKEIKIQQGDTLRNPLFTHNGRLQQFDCVLANPPFGLDKWGAAGFETDQWGRNIWGCPTDSNADYAWLQHMVCSMRPGTGRCAVVMPQGVLFHGGKEGEMRKKLIESGIVECVITLVGGLFYGAGVSACILFFNNNKPAAHKDKICLIDATTIYTAKRAQNVLEPGDAERIYSLWAEYENVTDYSAVVDIDTIRAKDYALTPNTYIEKTPAPPIDPAKVRREFREALREVREAEKALNDLLREGGYIDE